MLIWLVVVLCFLTFGSFIGVRVLMSLFALELGASQAVVGVLIAFFAIFPLFMSVYAGRVIDRVGYVIDHHGHRMVYLVLGMVMLLVAVVWFAYRRRIPPARAKDSTASVGGISQMLRNRNLRLTIIVTGKGHAS